MGATASARLIILDSMQLVSAQVQMGELLLRIGLRALSRRVDLARFWRGV